MRISGFIVNAGAKIVGGNVDRDVKKSDWSFTDFPSEKGCSVVASWRPCEISVNIGVHDDVKNQPISRLIFLKTVLPKHNLMSF